MTPNCGTRRRTGNRSPGSTSLETIVLLAFVGLAGAAGLTAVGGSFRADIAGDAAGASAALLATNATPVTTGYGPAAPLSAQAGAISAIRGAAELAAHAADEVSSLVSFDEVKKLAAELPDEDWRPRLAPGFDPDARWQDLPMVVIDFEGREGLAHEVGFAEITKGELLDTATVRMNPEGDVPARAVELRKLDDEATSSEAPVFSEKVQRIHSYLRERLPVAYNYRWDAKQLQIEWGKLERAPRPKPAAAVQGVEWIDVLDWVRMLRYEPSGNSLSAAFRRITGEELVNAHNAEVDAKAAARVLWALRGEMPETYGELIRYQVAFRKLRASNPAAHSTEELAEAATTGKIAVPKERVLDVPKGQNPSADLKAPFSSRVHWSKGRLASIDVRTMKSTGRPTEVGIALFDSGKLVEARSFKIQPRSGRTVDVVMREVAQFLTPSDGGAAYYPVAYNGVSHRFRLLDAFQRAREAGAKLPSESLPATIHAPSFIDPLPWVRDSVPLSGPATLEAVAPALGIELADAFASTDRAIAAGRVALKLEELGAPSPLGRFLDDQHELRVARIERRPAVLGKEARAAASAVDEAAPVLKLAGELDPNAPWRKGKIVAIDFEATGVDAKRARAIEIGWALIEDGKVKSKGSILVDPGVPISDEVSALTGITNDMIANGDPSHGLGPARPLEEILPILNQLWDGYQPVVHNARYDRTLFHSEIKRLLAEGKITEPPKRAIAFQEDAMWLDTLPLLQKIYLKGADVENHKLGTMVQHLGIELESWHRAGDDAEAAGRILLKMGASKLRDLTWQQIFDFQDVKTKAFHSLPKKKQDAVRRGASMAEQTAQ